MTTQFPETFDPETQEGNSWDVLPVGEYVAQIVEASIQQPKSGDGYYLALTWKIVEGEFEGRQVWQRITFAAFQRTGANDRPQDLEGSVRRDLTSTNR